MHLNCSTTNLSMLALASQQNLSRFMNPYAIGSKNPYTMSAYSSGASSGGGYGVGQNGGSGSETRQTSSHPIRRFVRRFRWHPSAVVAAKRRTWVIRTV